MKRPMRQKPVARASASRVMRLNWSRDLFAALAGVVTIVSLTMVFLSSSSTQFLMPGPLISGHKAIEKCSACHTATGDGKLSWVSGLHTSNLLADSKACISCHQMPRTAFNAHGISAEALNQSTGRLSKIAANHAATSSAQLQNAIFPTEKMMSRGLFCATCHQEHQGADFKLKRMTNEQCQSCHVVKFDSFDGNHPVFETYPFKRRTRIAYDHVGHFGKHFIDFAQKNPTKRVPDTCTACHNSREDRRIMAVETFDRTCSTCHLNQIVGKDRVSGTKGIAFLSLPGIDVQTLREKRASIGEWPANSEADLTPYMRVLIGRNESGRAVIESVKGINLKDLSKANDGQIKAVTKLAWEIKKLYYALVSGKASDVFGEIEPAAATLNNTLVADLTANLPRDVIVRAQEEWLPNLAAEIKKRKDASLDTPASAPFRFADADRSGTAVPSAEPRNPSVLGIPPLLTQANLREHPETLLWRVADKRSRVDAFGNIIGEESSRPRAERDGVSRGQPQDTSDGETPEQRDGTGAAPVADSRPQATATEQVDDLLRPTPEELRATDGGGTRKIEDTKRAEDTKRPAQPSVNAAPARDAPGEASDPKSDARVGRTVSIESTIDPESWAEYGGWYRQDYTIFYRPVGHKDKFIYTWLTLTGPRASNSGSTAASVFSSLTGKDAQGSCTKCHSIDNLQPSGRLVNFSPAKIEQKHDRFTNFIHEPHFGVTGADGCLTCHKLKADTNFMKNYEHGNPEQVQSSFGTIKKDLCQTCHTAGQVRQDCLTCHKYHVHSVGTPVLNTGIPTQLDAAK